MSLYQDWIELVEKQGSQKEVDEFWTEYFAKETTNYEYILENHKDELNGKLTDLAEKFKMQPVIFIGFIDGINTSLVNQIDLESLSEDTEIKLEIDFEKLYFNMHDAKADWLYNLPQWEGVLSEERRDEIAKDYRRSKIAVSNKVGRNDNCPCGSGKKYKKCCGK